LIRGVVDYLLEEFRTSSVKRNQGQGLTGLGQLRREFENLRVRLNEFPEQFTVMTELFVHAQRHPDVAGVLRQFEESWRIHVLDILESGMSDGSFCGDLDASATTRALMAQFMGIIYIAPSVRGRFLGARRLNALIAEIRAQVERWVACSETESEGTKVARSAKSKPSLVLDK
jgi:hypothetical protein